MAFLLLTHIGIEYDDIDMRILISGFEAFGGREINPTALLVEALENNKIHYPDSLMVNQVLLPVTFESAFDVLQEKIETFNPDVVISFGMAKRDSIEIETVAINHINATIADNSGVMPKNQLITPDGPPSYLSTLPVQGFETTLKEAGLPVKLSNDAGAFVCNYLFYRLMETNQESFRLCGFIHVPLLAEQAGPDEFGLPLEHLYQAVTLILNYLEY